VYVSDTEIQRLVSYWREFSGLADTPDHNGSPTDAVPSGVPLKQMPLWDEMKAESDDDPLLKEAIDLVRREGRASISMLQRRMRIGYTRAARMVDTLEEKGVIGPNLPNSQVRQVLDYGAVAPPEDADLS
jgi:S-DNA-T family DNA segregation ATPase FtsK/SpoIIIE